MLYVMGDLEKRAAGNKVDDTILARAATHSAAEISALLGGIVSPAAVAARTQELLRSKSWLTQAQEEQLITIRMNKILLELETRTHDLDAMKVSLQYLKAIADRLDKRAKATEVDLNALYANQGRIMVEAYDLALTYIKAAFREQIDPLLWDEVKREALENARQALSKYEVEA